MANDRAAFAQGLDRILEELKQRGLVDTIIAAEIFNVDPAAGAPLLGDRKYGGPPFSWGYILHAAALEFAADVRADGEQPATGIALPAGRLWAPLPRAAERRVREIFGETALNKLSERLSGHGGA